jgi:hypothetical protein
MNYTLDRAVATPQRVYKLQANECMNAMVEFLGQRESKWEILSRRHVPFRFQFIINSQARVDLAYRHQLI